MNRDSGHVDPALFLAYCEGELDASERDALETHIEHCGACRAELALAREVSSVPVGSSLGKHSKDLRSSFAVRLRDRLDTEAESKPASSENIVPLKPRRSFWLAGGLLAASLAVFAIGIYQLRGPSAPTDLGHTVRAGSTEVPVSLKVRQTAPDTWELDCQIDPSLKEPTVVITTSGGKIALERKLSGPHLSLTRADLGAQSSTTVLFAQIVAVDALGNQVRSKPERLPL